MIHSLRLRLAVGALVAIALALLATGFILSRVFTDYVVQRYRSEMGAVIDQLTAEMELRKGQLVIGRKPADPRFRLPASGRYWQVVPQQGSALRSPSLWDSELEGRAGSGTHAFLRGTGPDGEPVLIVERALKLESGDGAVLPFRILSAFPEEELNRALEDYHSTLRRMLLLTAAVLMGAAYLQGAIGLRPLTRLRREVADIRSGATSFIADEGPAELKPLIAELNLLLRERQTALERARARASDLAHGLKTPLTVLQQLADKLPEQDRALARQQVELVRQRADRQLQAARLGVEQMASTSLASLCGKLVMVLSPVTRGRNVEWDCDLSPEITIHADAADLAECLGNVLDNATRWAVSRILIRAEPLEGGRVAILVSDDGPGIAEADRERLLQRGETDERSAPFGQPSGSGLGLAISRDIAEAYGGRLVLGRGAAGGLEVRLDFPGSASA